MNYGEIREMARSIGQLNTYQIDDATIDRYIDEGYAEIVSRQKWDWCYSLEPETITLTSGTDQYPLDAKVKKIAGVIDTDQRYDLESVGQADWVRRQDSIQSTSRPVIFTFSRQVLFLFPVPEAGDTLDVYFYEHPDWIGADDDAVPPFDAAFHTMLVDWALHRAWEQEEDFQKSDDYRGRFEARLMRMVNFYNDRVGDYPKIYGQRGQRATVTNMPWLDDALLGGATS